jgi:hypothetical protein
MTKRGANYRRIEADHYATPNYVTRDILDLIGNELASSLCDPAIGDGRMLKEFRRYGKYALGKKMDFINDPFPALWHGCQGRGNTDIATRRHGHVRWAFANGIIDFGEYISAKDEGERIISEIERRNPNSVEAIRRGRRDLLGFKKPRLP